MDSSKQLAVAALVGAGLIAWGVWSLATAALGAYTQTLSRLGG